MEQELDYAEMLEIPVSTVNVVKKKGLKLFKRKAAKPAPQTEPSPQFEEADELKNLVVDSVNERVGAYVYAEDLSDPRTELPAAVAARPKRDKGSIIVLSELIAVCVIAVAIFLTNIFMPTSVINTFYILACQRLSQKERARLQRHKSSPPWSATCRRRK